MNGIGGKVRHVRGKLREGLAGEHECHWPGCRRIVPPAAWGCRFHWYRLPLNLRREIWAAYRPGQEDDKRPSAGYVEVARRVQAWIEANAPETQGRLL